MKKKQLLTGRRKFKCKRKIRGRGTPYVFKNRIYFRTRAQMGKGVVSKVLAHLLQNAGDIIKKYRKYRKYSKTKRKPKLKIRGRGIFGSTLKNFVTQWHHAV